MADPTPEPDFVRHLRELVEAGARLPQTDARRHHYVLSFLLARWATPQKREGKLTALTVATGSTDSTKPDKVAFLRELYSLTGNDGVLDRKIETFMSVIEQYAADPITRLGEAPQRISEEDRWTVAFFLALQQGRTPYVLSSIAASSSSRPRSCCGGVARGTATSTRWRASTGGSATPLPATRRCARTRRRRSGRCPTPMGP